MASDMLLTGAIGLALILLCTLYTLFILVRTILQTKRNGVPQQYEDKDGEATPDSTARFSNTLPKVAIGLAGLLGLGVSSGIAVLETIENHDDYLHEDWMNAMAWVGIVYHHQPYTANMGLGFNCHASGFHLGFKGIHTDLYTGNLLCRFILYPLLRALPPGCLPVSKKRRSRIHRRLRAPRTRNGARRCICLPQYLLAQETDCVL